MCSPVLQRTPSRRNPSTANSQRTPDGQRSSSISASQRRSAVGSPVPQRNPSGRNPSGANSHMNSTAACSVHRRTAYEQIQAVHRDISAVDRKVLQLLEEVKLNSQTTLTLLQHLMSSREGDTMADVELGRRRPVSTVEELELLNSDVAHSDMRGRLTRYLGVAGGTENGETARAVMRRLMTNDVARRLNWQGKGGKVAFGKMTVFSVVSDAVRRNPLACRATDSDMAGTLKVWLKHASGRQTQQQ